MRRRGVNLHTPAERKLFEEIRADIRAKNAARKHVNGTSSPVLSYPPDQKRGPKANPQLEKVSVIVSSALTEAEAGALDDFRRRQFCPPTRSVLLRQIIRLWLEGHGEAS